MLVVHPQGGGSAPFGVAVAGVVLVAQPGKGLGLPAPAAQGVAQFADGLQAVGVVTALEAVAESVEFHRTAALAVMPAVGGAQAQGQRAVLAQAVEAQVQAVHIALQAAPGIQPGA